MSATAKPGLPSPEQCFRRPVPSLCRGNPEYSGDIACMRKGTGKMKLDLQSSVSEMNPFQSNFTKVMKGFSMLRCRKLGVFVGHRKRKIH